MTEARTASLSVRPGRAEQMFPTLTAPQIARVAQHGHIREVKPGDILFAAGQTPVPFFVITKGQIEIVRPASTADTVVRIFRPGEFTGEANMLSGRPALVLARAIEAGEVIEVDRESLLLLVQTDSEIGEIVMTGASPTTAWLRGCVTLDPKGFIKTGPDLLPEDLTTAKWPLTRSPHLLETSLPGVFAVGDVRGGSIKRVASAVGEGSIAVAFVHRALAE